MLLDRRHGLVHAAGLAGDLEQRLELGSHARAEELVVVHDQHARAAHGRSSSTSSTSVPPPGALATRARPPWRFMRPTIESRTPRRSLGTADGVEARAAIADEHLRAAGLALGVHVHGPAAAELRRVRHRLASGGHDRLVIAVELAVAHHDHLDGNAVALLHLGGRRLERGGQPRGLARRGPAGEPRAQLALLAPRDAPPPRPGRRRCAAPWRASEERSRAGGRPSRRAPASGCAATRSWVSERTSRTTQGAKITPSTTTAAISASSTSRAAPSAPVA